MLERSFLARQHDLGGLSVGRVLPHAAQRSLGPFVFLDHMGPHIMPPGTGFDVRPHPHIGLATLTYLYEGDQMHRDSMGVVATILPGDVNLMIAGKGVVHSERSTAEGREHGITLHGLQYWLALPAERQEDEPSFQHADATELPIIEAEGSKVRLVLGAWGGRSSPVTFPSRALLLDVELTPGAEISLGGQEKELGVYVAVGAAEIDGVPHARQQLALLDDQPTVVRATEPTRLAVFGGDPLDGPRKMFWNFVATDDARIQAASERWKARHFAPIPGDDEEFIPLPELGPPRD